MLPSMLTVLFVGLKLTGHIDWSWWWVTSPMWIAFIIFMVCAVFVVIRGEQKQRAKLENWWPK